MPSCRKLGTIPRSVLGVPHAIWSRAPTRTAFIWDVQQAPQMLDGTAATSAGNTEAPKRPWSKIQELVCATWRAAVFKAVWTMLGTVRYCAPEILKWPDSPIQPPGSVELIVGTSREWWESSKIYSSGLKLVLLHFFRKKGVLMHSE